MAIPLFAAPIAAGRADYVKGNRFFSPEDARGMPRSRLLGNLGLSFMTKLSTGYWSLFDPNNGYVAIDARVAAHLPFDKIARRYFFESDMLFRLGTLRARVIDLPMRAVYDGENSSLNPVKMVPHFFGRHTVNTFKRITYSYFLRDFSVASIELVVGSLMLLIGIALVAASLVEKFVTAGPPPAVSPIRRKLLVQAEKEPAVAKTSRE